MDEKAWDHLENNEKFGFSRIYLSSSCLDGSSLDTKMPSHLKIDHNSARNTEKAIYPDQMLCTKSLEFHSPRFQAHPLPPLRATFVDQFLGWWEGGTQGRVESNKTSLIGRCTNLEILTNQCKKTAQIAARKRKQRKIRKILSFVNLVTRLFIFLVVHNLL